MKRTFYISLFILISVISCKSKKPLILNFEGKTEYEFIETKREFELILTEFKQNTFYCYTEIVPYALLIGKTNNSELPKKISVLSYCDKRVFKVGDTLKITPSEKPKRTESMGLLYYSKDTIVGGKKVYKKIGTENKAVWGIPNTVE